MRHKLFLYTISFIITISKVTAQQASYTDPAQSFNRLLIEKNNGTYTRVSNFKVIGSPYLYGEKRSGTLYFRGGRVISMPFDYNLYTQEISLYPAQNATTPLIQETGIIDSFTVKANSAENTGHDLVFIYGPLIGAVENNYYLKVVESPAYTLFKKYKCELGIVSTNYIQSELRQFDISYDYYYKKAGMAGVKKLKLNRNAIVKEFKDVKELSGITTENDFAVNPEEFLKKVFNELNGKD